jgi:putative heme degradation protein
LHFVGKVGENPTLTRNRDRIHSKVGLPTEPQMTPFHRRGLRLESNKCFALFAFVRCLHLRKAPIVEIKILL